MPIPTDTFWNIKKLNWVFAVSAVILFAVTAWSILQDWDKGWRVPQRGAVVWEAALTRDKIDADLTPDKQQRVAEIEAQIASLEARLNSGESEHRRLDEQVRKLDSDRETIEFSVNTHKSNLLVMEAHLQDAITSGDRTRIEQLQRRLAGPRATLAEESEKLAAKNVELEEARQRRAQLRADLDGLLREKNQLAGDAELLQKKLETLQPEGLFASVSNRIRNAPLMGFINPSERVQQVVLPHVQTDVAFMKITTVDRCVTCHVNIQKRDFTEENVVVYLEQQAATARGLALPQTAGGRAADPAATAARPGAVAMADFWHAWARQLSPDVIKRNATRLRTVTASVGKSAIVTYKGEPVASFSYDPNLDDAAARPAGNAQAATTRPYLADADAQSEILLALIHAWYRFEKPAADGAVAVTYQLGDTKVQITLADEKQAAPIKGAAMRYAEELRNGLAAALPPKAFNLLEDRYRYALAREVNAERRRQRLPELDANSVYLAHPRLDLYASQDSPHPMDAEGTRIGVGCTSCHDGSGQETDFVVAAHVPRSIWVDSKSGEPVLPTQLINPPQEEHREDLGSMLSAVFPNDSIIPHRAASLHFETSSGDSEPSTQPANQQPKRQDPVALLSMPAPQNARPVDYIDPVTGKRGKAVSQMTYWKRKYEPGAPQSFYTTYHYWDWPMRAPEFIQANCVRCHTEVYDIKEEAPIIYEGRQLFTQLGCVNCHQMDSIPAEQNRRVGTDLRHVTAKLSPEFINTWIWAPKAFRPSTKMPHFFMLENNSSDEEIRRTRQEARAMTEYLVRTATPLEPLQPLPPQAKGSPEAGRALFNTLGCLACHQNLNDTTGEQRDGRPVTIAEKWITTDLTKKPAFSAEVSAKLGKAPQAAELMKEARAVYDSMSHNERQLYIQQHLAEPAAYEQPDRAGAAPTLPKYPDGSPRPLFVQVGPELSGIGTKLLTGRNEADARQWLFDWLKDPHHYSDYTIMPRLRLNDQQTLDLVEYLLAQRRDSDGSQDEWRAVLTPPDTPKLIELTAFFLRSRYSVQRAYEKADDPEELRREAIEALITRDTSRDRAEQMVRQIESEPDGRDTMRMLFLGKKLIGHYGCMSCHSINGTEEITSPCTNLSDWGQKGLDKLDFAYLDQHKVESLPATTTVPLVNGLSAASTHLLDPNAARPETASTDPQAGGEFAAGLARHVAVGWPHLEHNRVDWLLYKLRNSRIYDRGKALLEPGTSRRDNGLLEEPGKPYEKLKMPTFYLSDEQVHAITTFVISNRDRLISPTLTQAATTEQATLIARGRELVERYNCVSCHQVENNVPQIQQYARPEEITEKWPPSLRGQGNKVQHDWLFNFFKHVEPLRPLLVDGIRMPSFHASDDEWKAIIAYFSAVSNKESRVLGRLLDPIDKALEAQLQASNATTRPADVWPEDDWWTRREFAGVADALKNWALENGLVREIELDPTKNSREQLNRTFKTILFRARFVHQLYNAPFPFTDSGRPGWDGLSTEQAEARFKLGEQLFYEMQCLKCHVLGDPGVEGAQQNPTAPNLSLTFQRLQRRWVRDWVQEPGIIQIGTKMPPFHTGLDPMNGVYELQGRPWPRSQGAPEEEIRRIESRYGRTVNEQTRLVLDFLYAAGARGYTGVQPVPTDQPANSAQPAEQPATAPAEAPSPTTVPAEGGTSPDSK